MLSDTVSDSMSEKFSITVVQRKVPSVTKRAKTSNGRKVVEDRVLAATARLLEGGASFTELSVGAIADESGIARSTFYVHFADKTELLIRLADRTTSDLFAIASEWLVRDGGQDALDRLEHVIGELVATARARRQLLSAVVETMAYDPLVEAYWVGQVNGLARHIATTLTLSSLRQAEFDQIETSQTAGIVAWSIERNVVRQAMDAPPSSDPGFVAALSRAVWLILSDDVSATSETPAETP